MTKYITIKMTRKDAYEAGLLICKCGHPKNNHYDDGSCAFAFCDKYREIARYGKIVKKKIPR